MDFVLVHGTTQSPQGWARLQYALEHRGHRGVSVDLHTDEPMADVDDYGRLAASQVAARGDIAVIAHSGSGTLLPAIAAALDAVAVVWLAAYIPDFVNGKSLAEEIQLDPAELFHRDWIGVDPTTDTAAARHFLFHDCNPDLQDPAIHPLRAVGPAPGYQQKPGRRPPQVASTVITPTQDRTLRADWIRRAATERLGVQPLLIDAGHCPHVSRAESLAEILVNIGSNSATPPPTA
ncbi:MAG: alpha/beta hydrolase [Mycobacterium sp.]|nr:alpha/beta hydrolase [Mycobacterium sp.]